MVYKTRIRYPRTIAPPPHLRQNLAAPQQRAHLEQHDMRISSSRSLSNRTPLWAVRDLQGIDKILAHGHTQATCLKVRARLASVSNTAVKHSSKASPALTHGEKKPIPYTEHLRIPLGTRASPSVQRRVPYVNSATKR